MPRVERRPMVALLALLAIAARPGPATGQGEAEALSSSFRKASKRVMPAVVSVRPAGLPAPVVARRRPLPLPRPPDESSGSGVVIDAARGHVLTNDHVLIGAERIEVVLHDGRARAAAQVRRDPKSDLALLVIEPSGLAGADWGDSDALETGDWVLAIGQPFGLSGTVTAGIVSGKGRGIGLAMYEDLIQTDAAINPGNSGGPLVNLKGQVVGINMATGMRNGGQVGVGFAVPAARARRVAADLAEFGRVRRAYLGLRIGPVDPATADRLKEPGAVVVNEVTPGSPASKAAIRAGDVIVSIDGKPVRGPGPLQSAIEIAPVGAPMKLGLDRDGERREVEARPLEQPERFGLPSDGDRTAPVRRPTPPLGGPDPFDPLPDPRNALAGDGWDQFGILGLTLSAPTAELVQKYRLEEPAEGLVIVAVERDGPGDRGGLEPGMVLFEAAGRKVADSPLAFHHALARRPGGRNLLVRIRKGSKVESRVLVDLPEPVATVSRAPGPAIEPSPGLLPELPNPGSLPPVPTTTVSMPPELAPIPMTFRIKDLDFTVEEATASIRKEYDLKGPVEGIVVTAVGADGPAHKAGLRRGMVIRSIGGKEVRSLDGLLGVVLDAALEEHRLTLRVGVGVGDGAKAETIVIPVSDGAGVNRTESSSKD